VNKCLRCGYNLKGPSMAMSDSRRMCSLNRYIGRRSERGAYGVSSSESSSLPVPWLDPKDASVLDSVAPSSLAAAASLLPASPELVASPLEELSYPAVVDVPRRV
jgi:hypothetical protein